MQVTHGQVREEYKILGGWHSDSSPTPLLINPSEFISQHKVYFLFEGNGNYEVIMLMNENLLHLHTCQR